MKKSHLAALALAAGAGAWCIHRNRKYPVRPELRFANKLAVPGGVLSPASARLANRVLSTFPLPVPPRDVVRTPVQISSEDGAQISLTLYRPEGLARPAPCLVYFHGGGFCIRDAGYLHRYAAQYAREARCAVVFVHYRTADISPFPTPFQDCFAALRWAQKNAAGLGLDPARLAVGGDSAGGALAAACTLRARDEGCPMPCFQLLIYPVTDCRMATPSMKKFTCSPMWNASLNRRMWALYLRNGDCSMPAYASPILAADFSRLPSAYVEVEEFDCLHDEGVAYAQALAAAGAAVQLEDVPGAFHGFDFFAAKKIARQMVQKRITALRQAFYPED